jgi:hypothetical protein
MAPANDDPFASRFGQATRRPPSASPPSDDGGFSYVLCLWSGFFERQPCMTARKNPTDGDGNRKQETSNFSAFPNNQSSRNL